MLICRSPLEHEVQHMLEIYNETVEGGGHSAKLRPAKLEGIQRMITHANKMSWPVKVLLQNGEVVGWSILEQMSWGVELCHRTAELSIYVGHKWKGGRAAARLVLQAIYDAPKYGFIAVSCWILGVNEESRALARACGLQRWGCLPKVAHYGDWRYDVEIWGCHFEDAQWQASAPALCRRLERICASRKVVSDNDV